MMMWVRFSLLCLVFPSGQPNNGPFIERRTFRALAFQYPPAFFIRRSPDGHNNVTYDGVGAEIMSYISNHFNLSIEYVQPNMTEVARKGYLPVMYSMLLDKGIDINPNGVSPTWQRWALFDYTTATIQLNFQMMTAWPGEESRLTAVIRPFSPTAWLVLAGSIIAVIGTISLLVSLNRTNPLSTIGRALGGSTMYVMSVMTNQGACVPYNAARWSARLLIGLWLLMMIILINLYMSTLTSYLTVPKLKPIPNTLEELAASKSYRITTEKGSIFSDSLLEAKSGQFKILGDSLRQNPDHIFINNDQVKEYVLKRKCVAVQVSIIVQARIGADLKQFPQCRFAASQPLEYSQMFSIILSKSNPLTPIVNEGILWAIDTGLLPFWYKKNTPNIDKCRIGHNSGNNERQKGKAKAIKLVDMSSAFLALGFGLGLSLVAFAFERVAAHCRNKFH